MVFLGFEWFPIMVGVVVTLCRVWQMPMTMQGYVAAAWSNRLVIELVATTVLGLIVAILTLYTERDQWTGDLRPFLFSDRKLEKVADREVEELLKSTGPPFRLDTTHPVYIRVAGITSWLLTANNGVAAIRDRRWTVVVLDSPQVMAYVEPNGYVFVYTGLASAANDHALSIAIGHELAHCLLRHNNQIRSVNCAVHALCRVPVTAVIWAALPFGWNMAAHLLCAVALTVGVTLPCIRSCEAEADHIGLELASNANMNVSHGHRFWADMPEVHSKLYWWMTEHPTNVSRSRHMLSLIPAATEHRKNTVQTVHPVPPRLAPFNRPHCRACHTSVNDVTRL